MENKLENAGFTLVETVIAVGIFTIVMAAISILFNFLYRQQGTDIAIIQRTQAANAAISVMGKELREANRAENGAYTIANAGSSSVTFYSDIDNDNLSEKITYSLQGTDLQKTVWEPGADSLYSGTGVMKVICKEVQNGANPVFTYYDKNYTGSGSPLASPIEVLKVKVVGISLDLNSTSKNSSYPLHIETKIMLRNSI